jgi:hypothetical protein
MTRKTPDTVQGETKSKPAKKWRAIYDPETDLNKLALDIDDDGNPDYLDKLRNKMHSLGEIKGDYVFTESLPLINQKLNSSDSVLKRTGTLFILCQDLLKGLQRDQFGKNFHPILVTLIFEGIAAMLARFSNARVVTRIRITTLNQAVKYEFLSFDTDSISFTHLNFYDKKIERLPSGRPVTIFNLMLQRETSIYLEDINKVISKLLPLIPYRIFVTDYISSLLS